MNRIIVTIRINQKKEYDLELPVHQKIKDLMQDISDSLEGLDPLSWFDPEKVTKPDMWICNLPVFVCLYIQYITHSTLPPVFVPGFLLFASPAYSAASEAPPVLRLL